LRVAETIIGLYKTELIRRRGSWKGLDDVEYATLEYVDWFNHHRLLEPIGYVPPAEFEAAYALGTDGGSPAAGSLEGSPWLAAPRFGDQPAVEPPSETPSHYPAQERRASDASGLKDPSLR
jgi:hypothetical protein